jgi:SH3-like domain-containing protein
MKVANILAGLTACIAAVLLYGTAAAADYPCKGAVNAADVNIRSGPSKKDAILSKVDKGFAVTVYAKSGEWYKIAVPQDVPLYISKKLVKESEGKNYEVTGDNVNIRTKPATDPKSVVLGSADKSQSVEVIRTEGDWLVIKPVDGVVFAYINEKYVTLEGAGAEPVEKPEPPEEKPVTPEPGVKPSETPVKPGTGNVDAPIAKRRNLVEEYNEVKAKLMAATAADDYEGVKKYTPIAENLLKYINSPEGKREQQLLGIQEKIAEDLADIIADAERKRIEHEKAERYKLYVAEGRLFDVAPYLVEPLPGEYKLKQGNNVIFYLKSVSPNVNLKDALFKHVGIIGKVIPPKDGKGIPLIEVAELDPLD